MSHSVSVGDSEMLFTCKCGWSGGEREIDEWDIQPNRDRVVRVCPGCVSPVPEWGAFRPIDGLYPIVGDDLKDAIRDQR